jgi:hypothetical protein
MNGLLLYFEQADTAPLQWLATPGSVFVDGGDRWLVSTTNSYIALGEYVHFDLEYDEEDGCAILDLIEFKKIWFVEWNDVSLLTRLLAQIPIEMRMVIDTDHGLICDFDQLRGVPVTNWIRAAALPERLVWN